MMVANELKARVKSQLKPYQDNAKTGMEIAKTLGLKDDRSVRLAIRELIAEWMPICASGKGYFIASSKEEADNYLRVLRSRLVQDAYRRKDFKTGAKTILNPLQLGLL